MSRVVLTESGLARIRKAVDAFERGPLTRHTSASSVSDRIVCMIKHAIVTTTIPAATSPLTSGYPNQPSTAGRARLFDWDAETQKWSQGEIVPILNNATGTGASISVGTEIKVAYSDGDWSVIWVLC